MTKGQPLAADGHDSLPMQAARGCIDRTWQSVTARAVCLRDCVLAVGLRDRIHIAEAQAVQWLFNTGPWCSALSWRQVVPNKSLPLGGPPPSVDTQPGPPLGPAWTWSGGSPKPTVCPGPHALRTPGSPGFLPAMLWLNCTCSAEAPLPLIHAKSQNDHFIGEFVLKKKKVSHLRLID